MKLQSKFTLTFVIFSILLISVSYFLINWNIRTSFENFSRDNNSRKWETEFNWGNPINNKTQLNPKIQFWFFNSLINNFPKDSPEFRFLDNTKNTMITVSVFGIIFSLVIWYLFSMLLLKRMIFLNNSMKKYNEDWLPTALQSNNIDEIDELINSYNLLIEKIWRQESIRKEFFTDMTHEIRTPLTAIKWYLEWLLDKVYEPKDEIFRKTLNEANRLTYLTKEMSNLAKLEAANNELNRTQTDFWILIQEINETLSKMIEKKGLFLDISWNLTANVDSEKFKQVIINLLNNAISYSPDNTTVSIELLQKEKILRISNVANNITERDIPNIFERFFRLDKSRVFDENKQHLWIWLSIVQKIVNDHKWKIRAYLKDERIIFEIKL